MKKLFTLLFLILFTEFVYSQQVFTTFQNASLVIGQPDFLSHYTGYSDSITQSPSYCAISSKGMLAVTEQMSGCVKIWYTLPTTNGAHADVVVGNPDFETTSAAFTQSSIGGNCNGVAWSPDGNKLIASDFYGDRVLIWNSIPTTNGQPADVVVGQVNFTNNTPATTASRLNQPTGVMVSPDGKLFVADRYNHRIMVWNSIPTTNGDTADVVIGQSSFTTSTAGYDANQLYRPWGMSCSPDGRLLLACDYTNDVRVFDSIPTTNGESATVVIGHTNFGLSSSGTSDSTMYQPIGVSVSVDGKVAVAEYGNNRVLIFDSIPTENNAHASIVLGQPDFSSSMDYAPSGSIDTNNFNSVYNVATDLNGRFFVVGRDMDRVLVFGELPEDSADLEITINSYSTALCDSSDVVYNIIIHNNGPDSAKGIVSTTAFPTGYSIESVEVLTGSFNQVSGYWNIPALAPDEDAQIFVNGLVDTGMAGQTITTYASIINSSAIDTNLMNNGTSSEATVLVTPRPADPVTTDAETCSGDSATVSATGEGTLYWFAEIDDVIPIDTGNIHITEILTGDATYYVEANNGCPSYNRSEAYVTVNPVFNESESDEICSGDSYTFPDGTTAVNILEDTIQTSSLITIDGCDSIIVTTLTVNPVFNIPVSASICSGDSYTFPDGTTADNIVVDTIQTSSLITINGCDSIVVTTLAVNPVFNIPVSASICSGDSYTFPDGTTADNIVEDTIQTSSLITINGCDSIVVTTLAVNPVYDLSESESVCYGDIYTFPDGTTENNITAPLSHVSNLTSIFGCDSIITTDLSVITVDVSVTQDGALLTADAAGLEYQWIDCSGGSAIAGETGQSFTATENGSYAVIITDNGCIDTSDCYSVVITATSILLNREIMIYPNPTRRNVTIDLIREYPSVDIEVLDVQGQLIKKHTYEDLTRIIEFDLHEYDKGVYLIRITIDDQPYLFRLIKE